MIFGTLRGGAVPLARVTGSGKVVRMGRGMTTGNGRGTLGDAAALEGDTLRDVAVSTGGVVAH